MLVLDDPFEELSADGLEMLSPAEVGIADSDLHNLAILLNLDDLVLACIPPLLKFQIESTGQSQIYLADDVCIYGELDHLEDLVENNGLVLTPRSLFTFPDDGRTPDQAQLLTEGLYNPGLVAVSPRAEEFL
ncbi:MAG: hypothetical protein WD178_05655, partial [Actinomycetota bacterium]